MSLLTVIQDAMVLCGQSQPSSVVSNTDPTVLKFLAFAQIEAEETGSEFNWRNLNVAMSLTGDGTTTLFALPSDFERILQGQALWSTKYPSIPLQGPISSQELLALKALPVMPVRPVWRLIGGQLEIWPALSAAEVVNGEYRSFNPIVSGDGNTRKARWSNDADYTLFPEVILKLGVIWRWKQSKGLDYAEDFRSYSLERDKKAGHEAGGRIVRMTNTFSLGSDQWPGVITVISP
ncbi:hypothetical protein JEY40_24655 [Bradyrhizobium japonicum]|uniref:phage adaptor protein n=1 Tax=Bradyrhizobium japonicum TaxID=375 RepID=UPI00200FED17|nr:hypothetical protein [Bradyrhizobium japonicum]UQD69210.1 hypothetical protein JEY40_24655 [Bradyrhizobium japonicum]WAX24472.1 hypothetical protein [Bradyrhizobium phage ppBjS10J-1]